MTTNLTDLATTVQTVFTEVADDLAAATGFALRRRKLTGPIFAQTTVFGWLHDPRASLADLAELATQLGAPVCPQSLDERFTWAAARFLQALLADALSRAAALPAQEAADAATVLARFTGVYIDDSTTISLPPQLAELFPGCGGGGSATHAAVKVPLRLELRRGSLEVSDLMAGRRCDLAGELPHGPLPAGSLRLADLGYFSLEALQEFDQQKVYVLSRLRAGTTLYDATGTRCSLQQLLKRQSGHHVDTWVQVGGKLGLRLRLIAWRVGPEVAAKRRQRRQRRAQRSGRPVREAQQVLAEWNVLLTNAPAELLGWREACVLARLRWQIELVFRLWKSSGRLDESAAHKPERVLCELLAKLLGLVVQHWALLSAGPPFLKQSQVRAAKRVRAAAEELAASLGTVAGWERVAAVVAVLQRLQQRLRQVVGKARRRGKPAAFQLAENPFDLEYFYMPAA